MVAAAPCGQNSTRFASRKRLVMYKPSGRDGVRLRRTPKTQPATSPTKKGEASRQAQKTARRSRSRSSYEPGVLSFRGFERQSAIGHDLIRECRVRLGRSRPVFPHAPNYKK